MELTIGYEAIVLPSPLRRVFMFMLEPANFIDLAAILPGIVGLFITMGKSGGFVVLRLIRLTRIFRAPALREPALIIGKTIQLSTRALYVLAFNLGLGIVIFGSLMFLMEQGTWDPQTRTYQRVIGRFWNESKGTEGDWDKLQGESPFLSIPQTFWWAIVTATTVGYGDDHTPTTSAGKTVAGISMLWSLCVL